MRRAIHAALVAAAMTAPLLAVSPAQAATRPSDCHVSTTSTASSGGSRYYTVTAWCNVIPAGSRIRAKIEWYGFDFTSEWTSVPGRRRSVSQQMYSYQFGRGTYQVGYY